MLARVRDHIGPALPFTPPTDQHEEISECIRLLDVTPQLDKAFADTLVPVGSATDLTFTITNTNELDPKAGWSFTDMLPSGLSVASPANASTTCTNGVVNAPSGSTTIQISGDLQTGEASCTADVSVTSSSPGTYENGPGNVTDLIGLNPPGTAAVTFFTAGITLDKIGSGPDPLTEGATVNYSFVVTNTGTAMLTNVAVTDPKPGVEPISCPGTTLAPSQSMTCTATYTVTSADATAGSTQNTATATGQPPSGPPVTAQDIATVPAEPSSPAIELTKSANAPTPTIVGSTIAYSFLVRNTGNLALENVIVTDPLTPVVCPGTTLAISADMTCTASYVVTPTDANAGEVSNTATATGQTPAGAGGATVSDMSSATVPIAAPVPALPKWVVLALALALLLAAGARLVRRHERA